MSAGMLKSILPTLRHRARAEFGPHIERGRTTWAVLSFSVANEPSIDHVGIGVLGVVTICAYGAWYYAFGVLLDPIIVDTGWRESTLAASFSAGLVLVGLLSLGGGRLLDRAGHRWVFALGGLIGSSGLIAASYATNVAVFFGGSAVGLGALGSLGFYHVTMTTAVRLNPHDPGRAIAVLTIWGALASAIFLPGSSWLVKTIEWRATVRVLALVAATAFWTAALVLPKAAAEEHTDRPSVRLVIASTMTDPVRRRFTMAIAFGGIAMSTMLVYQVSVMTAAGLSAGTAASMAGLRGFCQLGGRLPLTPIVARLGSDQALLVAFGAMTAGGALLVVSGNVGVAVMFAVVAGFGIGAFSPLQGMKAEELFERHSLGATMGLYGAVLLLAGSTGPLAAGLIADQTGERRWAGVIIVGAGLCAVASVASMAQKAGALRPVQR